MEIQRDSRKPEEWWARSDLHYEDGCLHFQGFDLRDLAQKFGTPLYVYNLTRIRSNVARLADVLNETRLPHRVFYAMKSNRFAPILTALALDGRTGVDVCSPGELRLALSCGFRESDVSFTGAGLSQSEWNEVLRYNRIAINCNAFGDIRKIGRCAPNRRIGIRVDPGIGIGYRQNPLLQYSSNDQITKFGIPFDELGQALALARELSLEVEGLHCHCGCGYLNTELPRLDEVVHGLARASQSIPEIRYINFGGGLGIPLRAEDDTLDLQAWSKVFTNHFQEGDTELWFEPGDYIVKDAGVLLLQVTSTESKRGRHFTMVNGGFNLHPEPVFYDLPLHPVSLTESNAPPRRTTIAGNINEALDLWHENIDLPPMDENDFLGFLNAGGYGAAMSSDHCRRGDFHEIMISHR